MNQTEALQRLRDADPATRITKDMSVTVDSVLDRAHQEASESARDLPARRRPRPSSLRVAVVAAAIAAVTAVPLLWPGAHPPISTAFAVTRDGDAVYVSIARGQKQDPQVLQSALDDVGLRSVVLVESSSCSLPMQDGLPAGWDVFRPDLMGPPDPEFVRYTFYPDEMPAGTTLLFSITKDPQWGPSMRLVDQVPDCVPDSLHYDEPETYGTVTDFGPGTTATPGSDGELLVDPTQTAPATS